MAETVTSTCSRICVFGDANNNQHRLGLLYSSTAPAATSQIAPAPATALDGTGTSFEKRGVALRLFQTVRDLAIARDATEGVWTIGRVSALLVGNHEILKSTCRWGSDINTSETLTFSDQCSLIDSLWRHYRDNTDLHPKLGVAYEQVVGAHANIFVSFAYSSDFVELVDALECYFKSNPSVSEATTFFWFDLFVNDQWHALDKSFTWWATTFREAIEEIGTTLCVLMPWDNPVPLSRRVWCLFEINCSKHLAIAMSSKQEASFQKTLMGDMGAIAAAFCSIDLEKSTAYLLEDKERIFAVVRNGLGFHAFNVSVMKILRDWIANAARALAETPLPPSLQNHEHLNRAALLLAGQGKTEEARQLYDKTLKIYEETHGLDHHLTLVTVNNLANLLLDMGDYEGCRVLRARVLQQYEISLGPRHEYKLGASHNFAVLLLNLGQLDAAYASLLPQDLVWQRSGPGPSADTLATVSTMANILKAQKKYVECQEHYTRALEGCEQVLGPAHPHTLVTLTSLANLYLLQGGVEQVEQARVLQERALRGHEKMDGFEHPSTLRVMYNLALVYKHLGQLERAVHRNCMKARAARL